MRVIKEENYFQLQLKEKEVRLSETFFEIEPGVYLKYPQSSISPSGGKFCLCLSSLLRSRPLKPFTA
jgi:hypothetical protein